MGLFRDMLSIWRDMGKVEAEVTEEEEAEAAAVEVGCRPPNVLGDVPPPPSADEGPAAIRARIMEMRGVSTRRVVVDTERCTLCGHCAEVCPDKAVSVTDEKIVDPELCTTCGCCISSCPEEAISIEEA